MFWRKCVLVGGVMAAVCGGGVLDAADDSDWRQVLALPEPCGDGNNACLRWLGQIESRPELGFFDQAVLVGELPDEAPVDAVLARLRSVLERWAAVLDAFTVRPGECAEFPRGGQMGPGFPEPESWQMVVRLKQWQMRVAWWQGHREVAATAAADLIRVGGRAARDATTINAWVTWMNVAREGGDAALWLARQIDVGDEELAIVSDALRDSAGAWPEGAVNALRGGYAADFQSTLSRLPETNDIGAMLAALTTLGLPEIAATAAKSSPALPAGPLLDVAATSEMYGSAIAAFIRSITADPVWSHGRFGEASQRRNEILLAELGVLGELAMRGDVGGIPDQRDAAVRAILARTVNPVGKLFVVMFTPNLDAMAYAGIRTEAQRRCVRVLIEWRRRIGRSEELSSSAAAWIAAGLPARDIEDPFSGQSLFFDTGGLRVWSVGIDGVDNHGTGDPDEGADGADFWWSLEEN